MTDAVPTPPKEPTTWEKVKDWASNNRVIAGAGAGGLAGAAGGPFAPVSVPGGIIIGGVVGWLSAREHEKDKMKRVYGLLKQGGPK